jgi:hypothetical protein
MTVTMIKRRRDALTLHLTGLEHARALALLVVGIDQLAVVRHVGELERVGHVGEVLGRNIVLVGLDAPGDRLIGSRDHDVLSSWLRWLRVARGAT